MLDWKGQGININGQYILYLFVDDIVIVEEFLQDVEEMLNIMTARATMRIGKNVNLNYVIERYKKWKNKVKMM